MLGRIRRVARNLAQEVRICRLVLDDPRTPRAARLFLGCAVAYALSPIDLIPDFIPVVGHLDDVVIVPVLLVLGLALVPRKVVREARQNVRGPEQNG